MIHCGGLSLGCCRIRPDLENTKNTLFKKNKKKYKYSEGRPLFKLFGLFKYSVVSFYHVRDIQKTIIVCWKMGVLCYHYTMIIM